MSLIRRKPEKKPHDHGLRAVALLARALVAQRVARKAYKGYKWTRRLPFIVGGAGIVAVAAFFARKAQQKSGGSSDAGSTPAPASTTTSPGAPASTPSTPTPTGAPTAVTPAPTAEADGAPAGGASEEPEPKT